MLPIRTILVPTDFSTNSKDAFSLALALARDYCARIVVAHVVEPASVMGADGVLAYFPAIDCQSLHHRLVECYPPAGGVPVEHIVAEGKPADEVVRLAADGKADVIVIGTHGRTGLTRLLMGSVAEQVLRKASCPVVTVKQPIRASQAALSELPECAPASSGETKS